MAAKSQAIDDPAGFIWSLGALHDVRIRRVGFDLEKHLLDVETGDLNANFTGLPEDPGRRPCVLQFSGVSSLFFDLDLKHGVAISDAKVDSEGSRFRLVVDLREGAANFGGRSMVVTFDRLDVLTGSSE